MKVIYQAENIIEAHIVAGLLEANGITAHVGGHHLQGGVGELMASGFANIQVDEADIEAARIIIAEYENHAQDDTIRFEA